MNILLKAPVRNDSKGLGHYLAPRGGRDHRGIDFACYEGSIILSLTDGAVTKIGYPYHPQDERRGHLRYVQISYDDLDVRYFYVEPLVRVGDVVTKGDGIGKSQDLARIYSDMVSHVHIEVKQKNRYINPEGVINGT